MSAGATRKPSATSASSTGLSAATRFACLACTSTPSVPRTTRPRSWATFPAQTFVDEQQVCVKGLGNENGRCLSRIQSEV
jgi:hypothetical protein